MDASKVKRKNGFEKPYNSMQIVTWILLPLLIVQFVLCISPIYPIAASIPISILYLFFSFCSGYCGYKACSIDPIDDRLLVNEDSNDNVSECLDGETKYCWACETRVGQASMHCKFCNKCVATFDHHCQWLNTCVGEKNYQYFFYAVVNTFLFVLIHTLVSWITTILYYVNAADVKQMTDSIYGVKNTWVIYLIIVFAIITLISSILVGQLWYFHINLKKRGITTYAFIVEDNAKRREKFKENMKLKRNRVLAKNKAMREGKRWYYCRLAIGEHLRPFDPICCYTCDPLLEEEKERKIREEQELEMVENGKDIKDINTTPLSLSVDQKISLSSSTHNRSDIQKLPTMIPVPSKEAKKSKTKTNEKLRVEIDNALQNEARGESNETLNTRPNDNSMIRTDTHR